METKKVTYGSVPSDINKIERLFIKDSLVIERIFTDNDEFIIRVTEYHIGVIFTNFIEFTDVVSMFIAVDILSRNNLII